MTPRQSTSRYDIAIALIRVIVGIVFIAHGAQKLFVFGFGGVGEFFSRIGVPEPMLMGPFIGCLEFAGGIALVLGLVAHVAGFLLACDMIGAMAFVHVKNGFFLPTGVEFVLVLGTMSAAVAIAGAGAYSLDALIAARRQGGARTARGGYASAR